MSEMKSQINKIKLINFYGCIWLVLLVLFFLFCYLNESGIEERKIILIVFFLGFLGLIATWRLSLYEFVPPINNIGFILISVSILYSIYPGLSFWLSDFQFSLISDNRLLSKKVKAWEIVEFYDFYLYYIVGLTIGYFIFQKPLSKVSKFKDQVFIPPIYLHISISLYIFIELFFLVTTLTSLSNIYFVQQLLHNLNQLQFFYLISIFFIGLTNKDKRFWNVVISIFFLYEFGSMILLTTGRTYFYLLIISFLICYTLCRKNISYKSAILFFLILFIFFLFWGMLRVKQLQYLGSYPIFSASNEFTSIFATGFDLFDRKKLGILPEPIPFSIIYNDLVLLIPSQFLSIEKWSLAQWYKQIIGSYSSGFGFGVIAQGVIGAGTIELLLRGLITGSIFALFHNYYKRNSNRFWLNVIYVYIAVRSYHIMRSGFGYIVYDIFYVAIPAVLIALLYVKLISIFSKKSSIKPI